MSRRWLGGLLALALAAAFSTTATITASSDASAAGGGAGSQRGITDSKINVALAYGDTAALAKSGLAPDVGDTEQNFQTFVDKANEDGAFGGRTVNAQFVPIPVPSTAADQLAACIEVTQDRENFFVIIPGGINESTMSCITHDNETILMMLGGAYTDELFKTSEGRLFANQMGVTRLFNRAVSAYDSQGRLKGKTIGIVRPSDPADEEAAAALTKALKKKGYKVEEEVALICEGVTCDGVDAGVERLNASGVDAVFSLLNFPAYPTFVGAAGKAGYTPQWFASDYANQTTASTTKFMQEPSEYYKGAIGTSSGLRTTKVDKERQACNDYFTEATGVTYEPFSDAWSVVANFCEMLDRSSQVVEKIEADGKKVGQNTFIDYMEKETVTSGPNEGKFGPGKHDAFDTSVTLKFATNCPPDDQGTTVCWKEVPGSRTTSDG